MNGNEKKVPKRRFKEFQNADSWEQRKLGEVASYRRGSFPQPYGKSEWYDGEDAKPFVQVADVTDAMNLVDDTKQKISKLAQPMSVFAEENSVLVTLQGSIGRVAITQYGAFIDRTVLIFEKYKTEIDTLFWSYVIKQKFIEEARKAPGGTIKTITKEALSDFDLLLPTYEEQQKIGVYFKQLDNIITLHQHKLDKLKSLKKAYLTNMFPAEGESKPKLRFAGFNDDWEQCKLEEVTSRIGDGLHGTPRFSEYGDVFFVNGNNFVDGNIVYTEDTKCVTEMEQSQDDKLLDQNTILMSINGTIGNLAFYRGERVMLGKSAAYITVKNIDKKFLYTYLQTDANINYFMNNLTGTTIKNLGLKTIRETRFFIPSIEEQDKIGEFFEQLDNLITLHQRKLEKLQNIKKAYLSEMFI